MANIDPRMVRWEDAPSGAIDPKMVKWESPPTAAQNVKQGAGDLVAGALRGAGSIGATLLYPFDKAIDLAKGDRQGMPSRNEQRREDMTGALQTMGADPESIMFQGGKIGTEILGTSGVGGLLAKGMSAAGVNAPRLMTALESGGFRTVSPSFVGPSAAPTLASRAGDMATRTLAGGAVGGASAGLVDPSQAGTGAAIGAAMPGAVKAAGAVGTGIRDLTGATARNVLGLTTGAGSNAVGAAYQAGKSGNKAFTENMRGNVPLTDVLDDAKAALRNMADARSTAYNTNMATVRQSKTPLAFDEIDKAISSGLGRVTYQGQVKDEAANAALQRVREAVDNWRSLDPAKFHTPEGMDALKQKIGAEIEKIPFEQKNARAVAGGVYNSVKSSISKQAPEYAKAMKDYSEASELITEIERSLSLGQKASADTAMRKLQSLMRNNVNTNYGNRLNLAEQLEQGGNKSLLPSIAGQAMSSATPRGLQGLAATGTGIMGLSNPMALAALPFQSPRLVGEAAYGLGTLTGGAGNAAKGLLNNPFLPGGQSLLNSPAIPSLLTVAPAVSMSQ